MVLEGASFSVAQDKIKGKVHFEHGRLISKDAAELFAEAWRTDGGQAKIIPILKSVFAAETRTNLWPVLSVSLCNVFFTTGKEVWRDKYWIFLPTGTSGSSWRLRDGLIVDWCSRIRSRRFGFLRWRSICGFCRGTFSVSCSGLCSWMRGANMSVEWCAVVKCFATCVTCERALGGSLLVGFQMFVQIRFCLKTLVASWALERFVASVDALMGLQMVWASEILTTDVTAIFLSRLFCWRWTTTTLKYY